MTSHIYLLLGKSPGAASLKSITKAVLLNQGFWIRGDSTVIPGAIDILSVGHHVGYFQTKDEKTLLNNPGGAVTELQPPMLDPTVAAYGQTNKWRDILTAAGALPEFQPNVANTRMYRAAREQRRQLTADRNYTRARRQSYLQRANDAQQRILTLQQGGAGLPSLQTLQQDVTQANQDVRDVQLGNRTVTSQVARQLIDARRQANEALQNRQGQIHQLQQREQQARHQAQQLQIQLANTLAQHQQDMQTAISSWNYRDHFAKKYLERQGMLMGTPNTLPIHGNFFFKKRTDVSTPRLALGCSQQTDYTYALFLFIRRIGPGLGGIRNPFLVIGLAGIKIVHWEMEGIDEENVALSYRNIAYGSLDSIADTNLPFVPSTRWFDRQNFHGSEGGWAATMMLAVQALFAAYGLAAKAAGGDW